jgi:hypothetical protein
MSLPLAPRPRPAHGARRALTWRALPWPPTESASSLTRPFRPAPPTPGNGASRGLHFIFPVEINLFLVDPLLSEWVPPWMLPPPAPPGLTTCSMSAFSECNCTPVAWEWRVLAQA